MGDLCVCGDVLDEHVDEDGSVGPCQVAGCGYFEGVEDDE